MDYCDFAVIINHSNYAKVLSSHTKYVLVTYFFRLI